MGKKHNCLALAGAWLMQGSFRIADLAGKSREGRKEEKKLLLNPENGKAYF